MLIKKVLAFVLSLALSVSMTACGEKNGDSSSGDKGGKPYVAVVSKGFQHQFWQIVKKGASQAAADLGVTLTFEGPQTESDVNQQVEMLKSAMNKQPDAICLAALDTSSVVEQLNECRNKNIPVVGFDSGVPEAPEGSIYATASTDNYRAAAIAAEQLLKNEDFLDKLAAGNNVVVGVLSQDAISDSILRRTSGFIDTLVEGLEAMEGFAGAVEVVGHDTFRKNAGSAAKVTVRVNVPATTAAADMKTGAEALLSTQNLAAIYGSNENAAGGISGSF